VLLVDDFHALTDVNAAEVHLPIVEFSPQVDFVVQESSLRAEAMNALDLLKELPRRQRARRNFFPCAEPRTSEQGRISR